MSNHWWDVVAMDGYGAYIWPCYALFVLVISSSLISTLKKHRVVRNNIKQTLDVGTSSDQQT